MNQKLIVNIKDQSFFYLGKIFKDDKNINVKIISPQISSEWEYSILNNNNYPTINSESKITIKFKFLMQKIMKKINKNI